MVASSTAAAVEEHSTFEVQRWRFVTLILLILSVDFTWEVLDKLVTRRLLSSSGSGLLHAWEHLKFETCALGLMSLLLAVLEVRCSSAGPFPAVLRSREPCGQLG